MTLIPNHPCYKLAIESQAVKSTHESEYRAIISRVWSIKGCTGDDASNHCCSDISQRQVESGGVMDVVALLIKYNNLKVKARMQACITQ